MMIFNSNTVTILARNDRTAAAITFSCRQIKTAAWLAQLGEHQSAEREVTGSNHSRTNT